MQLLFNPAENRRAELSGSAGEILLPNDTNYRMKCPFYYAERVHARIAIPRVS
jgi:hypothetical protein